MPEKIDSADQILSVAQAIVEAQGRDGLTMKALIDATGVPRATLYRRVGGRQEILKKLGAETATMTRRILQASRVVFTRQGLQGTTLEEIAQEAEIGVATIYRRFGTRDGLIHAFIEDVRPGAALSNIDLSTHADLEETLLLLAGTLIDHLAKNKDVVFLLLSEGNRPGSPLAGIAHPPGKSLARIAAYFQHHIDTNALASADARSVALAFIMPLLGEVLIKPMALTQGPEEANTLAKEHVTRFLTGNLP